MLNKAELQRWLGTLTETSVAIDEGGLQLVEIDDATEQPTGAYLEIGGVPLAEDG
jgi:hypothetical protein